jgi:hypothetical protein
MRDAAALWTVIEQSEGGIAARDGVWAHPDLMPTAEDLDDPIGYTERRLAAERGSGGRRRGDRGVVGRRGVGWA